MFRDGFAQPSLCDGGFLGVIEVALALVVQEVRHSSGADQEEWSFARDDVSFVGRITRDNLATPGGRDRASNSLRIHKTRLAQEQNDRNQWALNSFGWCFPPTPERPTEARTTSNGQHLWKGEIGDDLLVKLTTSQNQKVGST